MRSSHLFASLILALGFSAGGAAGAPSGELTVVVANFGRELLDMGLTTTQDLQYTGHIHDPLISFDEKGELTSARGLAESWTVSPDAKRSPFSSRPSSRLRTAGKSLTTDDVVFSLGERLIAPDATCTLCRFLRARGRERTRP